MIKRRGETISTFVLNLQYWNWTVWPENGRRSASTNTTPTSDSHTGVTVQCSPHIHAGSTITLRQGYNQTHTSISEQLHSGVTLHIYPTTQHDMLITSSWEECSLPAVGRMLHSRMEWQTNTTCGMEWETNTIGWDGNWDQVCLCSPKDIIRYTLHNNDGVNMGSRHIVHG